MTRPHGIHLTADVHPTATIAPSADIGPDTFIGMGVRIKGDTVVGARSSIYDWTTIVGSVFICRDVLIASCVSVDMGTVIWNGVEIVPGVTIGVGSYVGGNNRIGGDVAHLAVVPCPEFLGVVTRHALTTRSKP